MPVSKTVSDGEIRWEVWDIGGSGTYRIPYYHDPFLSKWLSLHEHVINVGRRAVNYLGILRVAGGSLPSGSRCHLIPHDATLIWAHLRNSAFGGTPTNTGLNILIGGSVADSFEWDDGGGGGFRRYTMDLDVNAGQHLAFDLSQFDTSIGAPSAVGPDHPSVWVGMRWRLD